MILTTALHGSGGVCAESHFFTHANRRLKKSAAQAHSNAQRSCVDEQNQHGVAHNEGYQDEKGATALAGAVRPVHEEAKEELAKLKK